MTTDQWGSQRAEEVAPYSSVSYRRCTLCGVHNTNDCKTHYCSTRRFTICCSALSYCLGSCIPTLTVFVAKVADHRNCKRGWPVSGSGVSHPGSVGWTDPGLLRPGTACTTIKISTGYTYRVYFAQSKDPSHMGDRVVKFGQGSAPHWIRDDAERSKPDPKLSRLSDIV